MLLDHLTPKSSLPKPASGTLYVLHYFANSTSLSHWITTNPIGFSGLDNAGKTTIVKRFNGEDVSTISPTLGFNIFTLDYGEYVTQSPLVPVFSIVRLTLMYSAC